MRRHRAGMLLFLGVLMVAVVGLSQHAAWSEGGAAAESAKPASEQTLLDVMNLMGDQMRTLRRSVRRAEESEASLKALHELQVLGLRAKLMEPSKLRTMPAGGAKDEALKKYRAMTVQSLIKLLEAEHAVLAGETDKARTLVTDVLMIMSEGHEQFQDHD